MNKCFRLIVCIVFLLPLLTGCWDRQELNELGIMLGLGVDKDGDLIKVSAQVVVPNEVSSKSGEGMVLLSRCTKHPRPRCLKQFKS